MNLCGRDVNISEHPNIQIRRKKMERAGLLLKTSSHIGNLFLPSSLTAKKTDIKNEMQH